MNAPTFQTFLNLPQQRRTDARFGPVDELDDHSHILSLFIPAQTQPCHFLKVSLRKYAPMPFSLDLNAACEGWQSQIVRLEKATWKLLWLKYSQSRLTGPYLTKSSNVATFVQIRSMHTLPEKKRRVLFAGFYVPEPAVQREANSNV